MNGAGAELRRERWRFAKSSGDGENRVLRFFLVVPIGEGKRGKVRENGEKIVGSQ